MKRQYGCERDIAPMQFFGEEITRCPIRMVIDQPRELAEAMTHYQHYKQNRLPTPGTWQAQSQGYLDLMEAVDAAYQEGDKARTDNARQLQHAQLQAAQDAAKN